MLIQFLDLPAEELDCKRLELAIEIQHNLRNKSQFRQSSKYFYSKIHLCLSL